MYAHLVQRKGREFLTPQDFLVAAVGYFEWCEENPFKEDVVFNHQGHVVRTTKDKIRVFTMRGLATHLGIPLSHLGKYRTYTSDEWKDALEMVEQVIHEQKFAGAVAGFLNASLIKSDLGMTDKSELTGKDGGPIQSQVTIFQLPDNERD